MRAADCRAGRLAFVDPQERLTVSKIDFSKVCVLLPAYNEERHIEPCLKKTLSAFPGAQVWVVDNNSRDRTAELAAAMGVRVLHEARPGKGYAVCAGVQQALAEGCAWIALHDSDNEYDADNLAALVAACQLTQAGPDEPALVMGVGLREVTLANVLWRSILANFVARTALKLATRMPPPGDILTGSRVLSAELAKQLFAAEAGRAAYTGFELETALTRKALLAGAALVCESVRYEPRDASEKKIKAWDMYHILKAAWSA